MPFPFYSFQAGTRWSADIGWVILNYVGEESIIEMMHHKGSNHLDPL